MELKNLGIIKIGNFEINNIEGGFGKGKKCVLVKDIAKIHNQELKEINRRINENISKFEFNVDIINVKSAVGLTHRDINYSQNAWNASKNIYLLSERGYLKLLKILEDDLSWDNYQILIDEYFRLKIVEKEVKKEPVFIDKLKEQELNLEKAKFISKLAEKYSGTTFEQILDSKAVELVTGISNLIPLPITEITYSATEVAKELPLFEGKPCSAIRVGKIAEEYGLKTDEYTQTVLDKSPYCNKEIPTLRYRQNAVNIIKEKFSEYYRKYLQEKQDRLELKKQLVDKK